MYETASSYSWFMDQAGCVYHAELPVLAAKAFSGQF